MKTKVIAMSIAGILSVENVVLAESRVSAIGDAQITQATEKIANVKKSLLDLDTSLDVAEKSIVRRADSGNLTRGMMIVNAAIAAGLSVLVFNKLASFRALHTGLGLSAAITTGMSAVAGGIGEIQKGKLDVTEAEKNLAVLRSQLTAELASNKLASPELESFNASLINLEVSLNAFKTDASDDRMLQLKSMALQSLGIVLSFVGMKAPGLSGSSTSFIGGLILIAGNVGPLLAMTDKLSADKLLKEIADLRKVIQDTANTL